MNSTHLLLFPAWDEITRIKLPLWRERRERRHRERRGWIILKMESDCHVAPQELFHNSLKQGSFFFLYFFLRFHSQVLNVVI